MNCGAFEGLGLQGFGAYGCGFRDCFSSLRLKSLGRCAFGQASSLWLRDVNPICQGPKT